MAGAIFKSSVSVLARAKQHVSDLDKRICDFLDSKPYARVVESDGAGNNVHKLKITAAIPDDLDNIAAEAVNGLRMCLDQAGYAIAIALNGGDPKSCYFPFADDAANLESVMKRRCKDFPREILALFRGFKPYKGGDDLLWAVNRICNTNKHKMLVPIGISTGGMKIKTMEITGPNFNLFSPTWDKTKNEIVIATIGPGGNLEYDLDISFAVTFNEVDVVGGMPAIPVLNKLVEIVGFTLERMSAKAYKMGLLK